ncbi:secondary thiamine-phosphate synthase enzyme YjbQ [Halomonas sp. DP8Y7-3]|uniref:secondary thiamine-phosphate synthase enzyme YjbQ n=1 Tax=Halomonas sp. DP8Y7-3 TaxID=2859079 RepID=UPI001C95FC42|nr:secondary thiamine-phosphate synthase enzyme YjbQ [Halomonas sp. DP8Y7-3]MBY5930448.1 secondary thiamine-phosphate synthase enzyme YjbQ [Halomonas sp. DP8Y7-3]
MWFQNSLRLSARPRGFHLITDEIVKALPDLPAMRVGLLHVFIQHTSASLTINENADPSVRGDFERHFNQMVPQDAPYYRHTDEGRDDMPAHLKASLLGPALTIPVGDGELKLGTWQGIYLCEHRDHGGPRQLIVTLNGERSRWRPEQAMPDPYRRRD